MTLISRRCMQCAIILVITAAIHHQYNAASHESADVAQAASLKKSTRSTSSDTTRSTVHQLGEPKLHQRAALTKPKNVRSKVKKMIEQHGELETAKRIVNTDSDDQDEQLEALAAQWAERDANSAGEWVARKVGYGSNDDVLSDNLKNAAISGYVEGVLNRDDEVASKWAELLQRQTRIPYRNPQNRLPESEPTATFYRNPDFPGDPGFPGDIDFLSPQR